MTTDAKIVLLLWCVFIFFIARPIVKAIIGDIKKEMKTGKTLRQVLKEMSNRGSCNPSYNKRFRSGLDCNFSSSSSSFPARDIYATSSGTNWSIDPTMSVSYGNTFNKGINNQ